MSHNSDFFTAGVWVVVDNLFVFMVGPNKQGDKLGVVRLGGHSKFRETPWMCAVREAKEEANLDIHHIYPPATYEVGETKAGDRVELNPVENDSKLWDKAPILLGNRSVYFLAGSNSSPKPMSEACGLLLLSCDDVLDLSTETMTLGEYLISGRQAIFREDLPPLGTDMELEPRGPKLLAKVLKLHPRLVQER